MIKLKDILLEIESRPVISIVDGSYGFTIIVKTPDSKKIGDVNIILGLPNQVYKDWGVIGYAKIVPSQRRKGIYTDMILAAIKYAKKRGKKGIVSRQHFGEDRSNDADMFWRKLARNQSKYGIKVKVDDKSNYYAS